MMLGGVTIFVSIPLMVVEPKPIDPTSVWHIAIAGWLGISVWALAAFVRTARLFVAFIRQYD